MNDAELTLRQAILGLASDAAVPLAVLYPELRSEVEGFAEVEVDVVLETISQLSIEGLLELRQENEDGSWAEKVGEELFVKIRSEYGVGLRRADEVKQLIGTADLWLKPTKEGRAILGLGERDESRANEILRRYGSRSW